MIQPPRSAWKTAEALPVPTAPELVQLRPARRRQLRRLPVPGSDRAGPDPGRRRRGQVANLAGLCAEDVVARRYEADGAQVLERRLLLEGGELDLVVLEGDTLVFVEVKRRSGHLSDSPVSQAQWRRLEQAASRYILCDAEKTGTMRRARFDVALVDADSRIRLVRNARTGEQY